MPKINDIEFFSSISTLKIAPLQPKVFPTNDPDISEIMARIKQADNRLLEEFEHTSKYLKSMVEAGEITKEVLLTMYINGINVKDWGRIEYKGTEYGTQDFFIDIMNHQKQIKPIILSKDTHEQQVVQHLVNALARLISIGQLDPSVVNDIENKSSLTI